MRAIMAVGGYRRLWYLNNMNRVFPNESTRRAYRALLKQIVSQRGGQ